MNNDIGVEGNCSTASLYYKDVCDKIYLENSKINRSSLFIHRKHLAKDPLFGNNN